MKGTNTPDLLSLNDAAARLGTSAMTVRRIVLRSELPAFKAGGQYRIRAEDLSAYIRQAVKVATRKQRAAIPA